MESYEIVKRAIEFGAPERVPMVSFAVNPDSDNYGFIDYGTPASGAKWWEPCFSGREDEWGCIWETTEAKNMGQVKYHPLKNWDKMKGYGFPDPGAKRRFSNLEILLGHIPGKYVILNCPSTLLERMNYLHGFSELLQDFHLHPKKVHELAERILSFQTGIVHGLKKFKGRVHGIWMTDDWGTQNATIIGLPLFREFFKPRYKKLFSVIHDMEMHAWLHSCGKVNEFIDEFIDIGLDVINFGQPRLVGIEEVGNKYAGKICFANFIDIQTTLPHGTLDEIRAEARLIMEKWGTPRGGFVALDFDYESIGVSKEKRDAMLAAFEESGEMLLGRN